MCFLRNIHRLAIGVFLTTSLLSGCTQELQPSQQEADTVDWYDDYYTIEYIDSQTIAIGEPRYHQQNYSYLILGDKQALLFDSGPGIRDIKLVVKSLTNLPIIVTQSHFHYDHIGNHQNFERVAVANLPGLQDRVKNNRFNIHSKEHLGFVEKIEKPELIVSDWWSIGENIELGGRLLKLIHTPGHTKESITLFDYDNNYMFTGDFLCPGPNLAALPGSSIDDYLASTQKLLAMSTPKTQFLTGHRDANSIAFGAPMLMQSDLNDFRLALKGIIAGTLEGKGFYINQYQVNERIDFIINQ
ncbi:MBL fold metallo-hydrolase [Vibrio maritimus]